MSNFPVQECVANGWFFSFKIIVVKSEVYPDEQNWSTVLLTKQKNLNSPQFSSSKEGLGPIHPSVSNMLTQNRSLDSIS